MPIQTASVGSTSGLHARPASLFAQAAAKSGAKVTIAKEGGTPVNAASVLSLLSQGIGSGETVTLEVTGDDAESVLADLVSLVESNLDEH